jgi:hypothetical protein
MGTNIIVCPIIIIIIIVICKETNISKKDKITFTDIL